MTLPRTTTPLPLNSNSNSSTRTMRTTVFSLLICAVLASVPLATAFSTSSAFIGGRSAATAITTAHQQRHQQQSATTALNMVFGGGGTPKIPSSANERDKQAIAGIQAACKSPKDKGFPLIECEFPPLQSLNKLGDGSLRSAQQVEQANLAFCKKLAGAIQPFGLLGPPTTLLVSGAASNKLVSQAKKSFGSVHFLRDGLPLSIKNSVYILMSPCIAADYSQASQLARGGAAAVILINGLFKDPKSVSGAATMAYYNKPLTYNSCVVGSLIRQYPGQWATVDGVTGKALAVASDDDILVRGTNTPDLRASGKLVQKAVDQRAIASRKQ